MEPIVPTIFQRTKATCFAYGQTGKHDRTYLLHLIMLCWLWLFHKSSASFHGVLILLAHYPTSWWYRALPGACLTWSAIPGVWTFCAHALMQRNASDSWLRISVFLSFFAGSGKTYTMQPLPLRATQDIMALMQQPTYRSQGLQLWLSFFEIYGGKLYDLLNERRCITQSIQFAC